MKDVRRADGWTVLIYLGDAISITHSRWEQSLQPENDPKHFECHWEIRLSFDKLMSDLRAVFLRIQDISFHKNATVPYQAQILDVLKGSGYIV